MNSTACSPKIIIPDLYNHHHHPIAPMARCEKTAEERFNMLARGWLAYPVTPTHAHLPPKSGCINVIPVCANGALLLVAPPARRGGTPPLCASEMRCSPPPRRGKSSLKKPPSIGLPRPVTPTPYAESGASVSRKPRSSP